MKGYMGVFSAILANFLYLTLFPDKHLKKKSHSHSFWSMIPLMGNFTAMVTREGGRNSWLLWVLPEVKNQKGHKDLPHNQRQAEAIKCPRKPSQQATTQPPTLVPRQNQGSKKPEGSTRPRAPLLQHQESTNASLQP